VIGTIGYRHNARHLPTMHTTPDAQEIHRILAEMVENGVNVAVMEVSSHAADMRRVDDVFFDLAVFTNLTPEHLDYHKSMELYFESKKRLFSRLLPKGKGIRRAVLNADDGYGLRLIEALQGSDVWTYSTKAQSKWNCFVQKWRSSLEGMSGTVSTPAGVMEFSSPLIGSFNLSNILAATCAALSLDVPLSAVTDAVREFSGVPGRLERISDPKGTHIFVDYAHTPDALKNVLKALRELDPKRILTVFGCGGDRDKTKRPIMGREVARLSDLAFVTSDNPRTEDPNQIIQEILPGIEEGGMSRGKDCIVEPDRRKAIESAIGSARPGDVVLIAGKGHEDYQIIGTTKTHFDDREVAREALGTKQQ
jgi:UDP-N-acetylmuramoyl-L-alanyl-D-glutamate--2,6-diaminopimelate ligase